MWIELLEQINTKPLIVRKSEQNTEGSNMCLYTLEMTVDENSELHRYQKFIIGNKLPPHDNENDNQTNSNKMASTKFLSE